MKILSLQALRGPNYWSTHVPQLIQVRVDVKMDIYSIDWQESLTLALKPFPNLMPQNAITESAKLAEGLALAALAIQQAAGLNVNFFQIKPTLVPHIYNLVFEYATEAAGKLAAKLALEFVENISIGKPDDFVEAGKNVAETHLNEIPTQNIQSILTKAKEAGIPILKGGDRIPWQLGFGKNGLKIGEATQWHTIGDEWIENQGRIPIIAVTGSNGKTTTTRLIAHFFANAGYNVGFTTSDGIYIGRQMTEKGDTTGPLSAEIVLRNPDVDFAVLETARGGIVRAGLGFDCCDIGVVTNVQEDHLGISDIETMEDLAGVKSVIIQSVKTDGCAVLNAENPWTVKMGKEAKCKVAWYAEHADNEWIQSAFKQGSAAMFSENGKLVYYDGVNRTDIIDLKDIPITFGGTVRFMVQNTLAATLTAAVYGMKPDLIAKSLKSFLPSAEQTPGRMNIFDFGDKKVMVDFAHNPDGFAGIRDFLKNIDSTQKIGIVVATGDRKESDVRELGRLSAEMFDLILIHQVKFLRGKTAEVLVNLLVEGMHSVNPNIKWERVADEIEPLGYALSLAKPGSFITALSDVLDEPTELVKKYKSQSI